MRQFPARFETSSYPSVSHHDEHFVTGEVKRGDAAICIDPNRRGEIHVRRRKIPEMTAARIAPTFNTPDLEKYLWQYLENRFSDRSIRGGRLVHGIFGERELFGESGWAAVLSEPSSIDEAGGRS